MTAPSSLVALRQHHCDTVSPPERHHLERVLWSLDFLVSHALAGPARLTHSVHRRQSYRRQHEAHDGDRYGLLARGGWRKDTTTRCSTAGRGVGEGMRAGEGTEIGGTATWWKGIP